MISQSPPNQLLISNFACVLTQAAELTHAHTMILLTRTKSISHVITLACLLG